MEENQFQTPSSETSSGISFPNLPEQPKKSGSKTFLILGILVVIGVIGFLIFKSFTSTSEEIVEDQPFATESPIEVVKSSPTSTPKPVDKSKIEIEIQNGTGITGEAAYLQTQLKSLDYKDFVVGNASTQNETTTTVTFSKDLSSTIVEELTTKLKDIYKTVEVKTSSTLKTDVLIVTGLKKGATAKASTSPVATSSVKPTVTGTAKASTTPSPTATSN